MSSRALAASLWNFLGSWGQQLASVVIFLYLIRMLDAADFGLVALAAAVIDIMTVFGRFGQVEALMQRRKVSQATASTSFWLLTIIGIGSLVLFAASAGEIGDLMGDQRVAIIILILSPVPLIFNLTQVHEYFLRRNFQYKNLAFRNFLATLTSGIVAVVAANLGYGFYALVLQKFVFTIVYSASLAVSYRWTPSFRFVRPAATRLARSGIDVVVANIIPMVNLRIVDVLVGYYLGVVALGYLRTASRLYELMFQVIVNPILTVSMTSLTAARGNMVELRDTFLLYLRIILMLSMPIFSTAALMADDLILLAAGSKWEGAIMPFRLFCFTTAALSVIYLFVPLMLTVDRTRTVRNQAFFQFIVTAATTAPAVMVSLFAVIVTHVLRTFLFAFVNLLLASRYAGIALKDVGREFVPPIAVSCITAGLVALADVGLARFDLSLFWVFSIKGLVAAIVFVVSVLLGEKLGLWRPYTTALILAARGFLKRRRPVAKDDAA
jgi:O-antigen/teichoic acid export membrane protein